MTSGQRVLVAAFALLVAGGAVLIAGQLSPPPREKPPVAPPGKTPASPTSPPVGPARPPSSVGTARRWNVEVLGPDGARLKNADVMLPSSGGFVGAGSTEWRPAGGFARAEGFAWTEIPEPDADGTSRVKLRAAGGPLAIEVRESSGAPAHAGVAYGPLGASAGRVGLRGGAVIRDAAPGVLRVRVGWPERGGPLLRLVVGRDTNAEAVLDPPWTVTGRVLNDQGRPMARVLVRGVSPDGSGGETATDAEGKFRWEGRISERTALVASAEGFADASVEPSFPDPRAGLASAVEIVMRRDGVVLEAGEGPFKVTVEPAVLAVARDLFGATDVVFLPTLRGSPSGMPLRISVRGDVVPEDHLVAPGGKIPRIAPQFLYPAGAPLSAPAEPPAKDPRATAFLAGKVVDPAGAPLQGVTVDAGDVRATTAADGTFRLEGLVPGRSLDLVYGWIDGADPGSAHPKDFAPHGTATLSPSTTAALLPLRRAARLQMRVVDGLDDAPLSWVRLVVSDGEGGVVFDGAVATREGRIDLEGLAPETGGTLVVLAPGYRREVPLALRGGATTDAGVVRLTKGAKAVGTVRDARGAPVAGARVALLAEAVLKTGAGALIREHEALLRRGTTDAKGEVTIEGLDPSRAAGFAVWAEGFAPTALRANAGAAPGDPLRFEAKLRKGAHVVLRITDPSNAPVSGAVVDLRSALTGALLLDLLHRAAVGTVIGSTEDARVASATMLFEDPSTPGKYRVGPVEPGPYELEVQRPGFRPLRWRFSVPDDGDDAPAGATTAGANPVARKVFGSIEWPLRLEPLAPGGR